jgi:GNAT superfamily N-acetyltransferase
MIPFEFFDAKDRDDPNHGLHLKFLYDLLEERIKLSNVNISHVTMPTWEEHILFVEGQSGYAAHWIIANEGDPKQLFATMYVTERNEIGLFVAAPYRGKGYGKAILQAFLDEFPGTYYANLHPENFASKRFFCDMGFKPLQHTYVFKSSASVDEQA